jgi:hypothetical protein
VVGAQDDRPDPPGLGLGGRDDGGAGAVGEQRRGIAIGHVEEARQEVGAHHERMSCTAGLDLPARHRQCRQPPGARGADVERAGAVGADQPCHERRCVGRDVVGGRGGDEHEIQLTRIDVGVGQGGASGVRGEFAQELAVEGPRPLASPGPLGDPVRIDVQVGGDLLVRNEPLGQRHRDTRD